MPHLTPPVAATDTRYCEPNDTPAGWCPSCRGQTATVAADVDVTIVVRRFTAGHDGQCREPDCKRWFDKGDRIGVPEDGTERGYVCPDCCDRLAEVAA